MCLAAVAAGFVDDIAAIATNKVQSSFGTASATWSCWRAGRINFGLPKWPLASTLGGAGLGAFAVTIVYTRWRMVLLPVLQIAIALYFLFGPKASDEDAHARLTPLAYSTVAGGIDFYDGFFRPGAGSFFVLRLVTLVGMGLTWATANIKALNLMSNVLSVVVLARAAMCCGCRAAQWPWVR